MLLVVLQDLLRLQNLAGLVVQGSPSGRENIEAQVDPGSQLNLADPLVLVILRSRYLRMALQIGSRHTYWSSSRLSE